MVFTQDTWWLFGTVLTFGTSILIFLLKKSTVEKLDVCEKNIEIIKDKYAIKVDVDKIFDECKNDIKKIREDYTPIQTHIKDFDECKNDIKKIKEDYITKEDFFREQGKTDRKLDKIMDILLEIKGERIKHE